MVRLLNSPQSEIPVRGDSTTSALAKIGGKLLGWMMNKQMANQMQLEGLQSKAREQRSTIATKLINNGATPEQAWSTAVQMTPTYSMPQNKDWLSSGTPFGNLSIPVPDFQKIAGNVQSWMAGPQANMADKISMPKLRNQKTLKELGANLPKNISWLGNFTPKEVENIDQVVKWSMLGNGSMPGGAGSNLAINPTVWNNAEQLADKELTADINYTVLKVDDPGAAGYYRSNKIRAYYDKILAGTIGTPKAGDKPADKPAKVGDFLKSKAKGKGG